MHAAGNSPAKAWVHWVEGVHDPQAGTDHQQADNHRSQEAEQRRGEGRRNQEDPQQAEVRPQEVRLEACLDEEAEAAAPRESAVDSLACPWTGCPDLQEAVHRGAECPKPRGYAPRSFASGRTAASPR